MGGMFSRPSAPAPQPVPAAPAPIDYDRMANASIRVAEAQTRAEEEAIKRLYPQYIGMQFDTADQLSRRLDNNYLASTRNVVGQELTAASRPSFIEDQLQSRARAELMRGPSEADLQIRRQGLDAMGVRANQVSGPQNIREVSGARAGFVSGPQAAMARGVSNVGAGQVGAGALGDTLMAQAMRRAQSDGRLSAEASRDAVQAARAGMAARGMATGSAGLAAEMLNRDRFARSRQAEDLAFAQGVQGQDVERQFANVANRMRADQGNQEVSARMALADQAAQNQMGLAGYQGSIEQIQAQAARNQQANMANQQRDQVLGEMAMRAQMANQAANQNQLAQNRAFMLDANSAFLGAEDRRRAQALGADQLDLARRQRRIGLAGAYGDLDPFRQGMGPAFGLGMQTLSTTAGQAGNTFGRSMQMAGGIETFNTNMAASNRNAILNNNAALQAAAMQAGASQNAGMMGMFGGIGGGVAAGAGMALAGASF